MLYLQMILFLSMTLFVIFSGHLLIYETIIRLFSVTNSTAIIGMRLALISLPLLFIGASIIGMRYNNILSRTIYAASATWLGFVYFFSVASILSWGLYGMTRIAHLSINRQWTTGLLFAGAIGLGIYGIIHANNTQVTPIAITIPDLPARWKGRTAIWVSDVHLGQIYGQAFSQKLASKIKNEKPDIIFIGGDLYDGSAIDVGSAIRPFAQLTAPQGVYFITGNHEEFTTDSKFTDAVRRAGIRVLNNESVVRDGLRILGVDYLDSENKNAYMKTLEELDTSYPTILLKHAPNNVDITKKYPIALQLSGHTHDGQLWPLGYISARVFHGFDKGLNSVDGLQVYTSVGAGTWGPPLRVGTTPEIVLITFH